MTPSEHRSKILEKFSQNCFSKPSYEDSLKLALAELEEIESDEVKAFEKHMNLVVKSKEELLKAKDARIAELEKAIKEIGANNMSLAEKMAKTEYKYYYAEGYINTLRDDIERLESLVEKYEKALKIYADESNWGNGGFEGHPNDLFLLSRDQVDRAWKIAQEALGKEKGLVK